MTTLLPPKPAALVRSDASATPRRRTGVARRWPWVLAALLVAHPAPAQTGPPLTYEAAAVRLREGNEALRAASDLLRQRREEREAARAYFWPTVSFGAMAVRLSSAIDAEIDTSPITAALPLPLPPALQFELQGPAFAEVNVSARYVLYSGGKVQALNRAAELQVTDAELEAAQTADGLQSELVRRYFGVRMREAARTVREEAMTLLERLRHDARRLEEEGLVARTERLAAEVAHAEGERQLRAARSDVELSRIALASLLSVDEAGEVITPLFVAPQVEPVAHFVEAVRASNPQLARVRTREQLAREARKAEVGHHRPDVFLFASQALGRAGLNELVPHGIYGVGATWTVFDGPGQKRKLAAADAQIARVQALAARAERDLVTLVEMKHRDMRKALDQFETLESSLALAAEHLRARTLAFSEGLGTALEVADAQVRLVSVRIERAAAAYHFVVSLAELLEASGQGHRFEGYRQQGIEVREP